MWWVLAGVAVYLVAVYLVFRHLGWDMLTHAPAKPWGRD